ncbi:MAG: flagellar export chaperone FliS [Candidatus Aquicultor sp.]
MNTAYAQNAYTDTMVATTANPLDLIIQLYDGAISRLNKAIFCINQGNITQKIQYITRTIAIIEELLASLDMKAGGEVAVNLQGLYVHMLQELTIANANNDVQKIKQVEELLKELRGAWKEIR